MLYATTDKFLRVFGLNSLSDLPATEIMLPPKEDIPMLPEDDSQLKIEDGEKVDNENISE